MKYMFKKMTTIIVLSLFLLLSINPLLGNAETTTIASEIVYVNDDNTAGPWDGTQDHPYLYIQDGVDAAEPGDTVFVYGGFYNEHVSIDKPLTLQGESMEDTILDGTGLGRLCDIEETTNVKVSGFTLQNAEKGILALYLYASTSCIIEQNCFTRNNDISLYVGGGDGHTICENEFIDNPYVNNTVFVMSTGNTLANNIIENNKGSGVAILARDNLISGNVIEDNKKFGIALADSSSIKHVVISDNIIKGNKIGIATSDLGSFNEIINNTISRNKIAGIIFGNVRSTISHNTIEKSPIGLFQRVSTLFNNISHNTFSLNLVGIQNLQTMSNTFTENNFIKNIIHASFLQLIPFHLIHDDELVFDSWDNNYWGNWRLDRPKPIFGLYCSWASYVMPMPYCLYDQNPASEPF